MILTIKQPSRHMNNSEECERSSKNTRLIREMYTAFGKRDINSILAVLSPEVIWGEPDNPYNPSAGTRYGHAGFMVWWQIGKESEEILNIECRQFVAQHDTVAVAGYTKCLVKATGKSYATDFVHLITIRDGKIIRFREFFDTYTAAEAFRPVLPE